MQFYEIFDHELFVYNIGHSMDLFVRVIWDSVFVVSILLSIVGNAVMFLLIASKSFYILRLGEVRIG
jgi:hypothetical protein